MKIIVAHVDVGLGTSYSTPQSLPVHNISPFPIITIGSVFSAHCNRSAGALSAGSFADFVNTQLLRSRRTRGGLLTASSARMEQLWECGREQQRGVK